MSRPRLHWLWLPALLLSACSTSLQMSPEELRQGDSDDGTVVGSVQIEGGETLDLWGRTEWTLEAILVPEGQGAPAVTPRDAYEIHASHGSEEALFVARMPPGLYAFWQMHQDGPGAMKQKLDIYFRVRPRAVSYVGRLVIRLPARQTRYSGEFLDGCTDLSIRIDVEDARAGALERAGKVYGVSTEGVASDLMKPFSVCRTMSVGPAKDRPLP